MKHASLLAVILRDKANTCICDVAEMGGQLPGWNDTPTSLRWQLPSGLATSRSVPGLAWKSEASKVATRAAQVETARLRLIKQINVCKAAFVSQISTVALQLRAWVCHGSKA